MPEEPARVFRAIHMPRRRREAENATDGAPINVQPGELLYDYEQNKLYAGLDDETAVQVGGADNNYVESDAAEITGATVITNIVKITQTGYNALATKDPATVYYIVAE
jgi:hypothetical protein